MLAAFKDNRPQKQETKEFGDLCEMAGRFSDDEEELKIPNMFFSADSILNKAKHVKQLLE